MISPTTKIPAIAINKKILPVTHPIFFDFSEASWNEISAKAFTMKSSIIDLHSLQSEYRSPSSQLQYRSLLYVVLSKPSAAFPFLEMRHLPSKSYARGSCVPIRINIAETVISPTRTIPSQSGISSTPRKQSPIAFGYLSVGADRRAVNPLTYRTNVLSAFLRCLLLSIYAFLTVAHNHSLPSIIEHVDDPIDLYRRFPFDKGRFIRDAPQHVDPHAEILQYPDRDDHPSTGLLSEYLKIRHRSARHRSGRRSSPLKPRSYTCYACIAWAFGAMRAGFSA